MKILWIINSMLPEAQALVNGSTCTIRGTGGWLSASADILAGINDIQLAVVSLSNSVDNLRKLKGEKVIYYIVPRVKSVKKTIRFWQQIYEDFNPDVIHLHGSELPHGLSLLEALPDARIIISIQGLISQICKYYCAGMGVLDICSNITVRDIAYDIIRPRAMYGTLFSKMRNFKIRGQQEILIYKKASVVIGRTIWDKANVLAINPKLRYYVCNETLRPEFYSGKWSYDKCVPHTIFLSQATDPFKGLHMVIKALPFVLRQFPDTKIIVAGKNILNGTKIKHLNFKDGYAKYICRLIKKLGLTPSILSFTGALDADGMKQQYLKCNVFISPSAIENSSNSVCEAQILGVPLIASDAGGTSDLIPNNKCGYLYRFEDVELLAYYIIKIFSCSCSFDGTEEMEVARKRHDGQANIQQLINIYKRQI